MDNHNETKIIHMDICVFDITPNTFKPELFLNRSSAANKKVPASFDATYPG
jgi:hypothetical protein